MGRLCGRASRGRGCVTEYTVEHFGDSKRLANDLLGIVLSGKKRATAELVADFIDRGNAGAPHRIHWIACDGDGLPSVIIRSTELRIGPFTSVDAAFARDEEKTTKPWKVGSVNTAATGYASPPQPVGHGRRTTRLSLNAQVVWPLEHADGTGTLPQQ